jgi:hypothetical protein
MCLKQWRLGHLKKPIYETSDETQDIKKFVKTGVRGSFLVESETIANFVSLESEKICLKRLSTHRIDKKKSEAKQK